MITTLLLLAPLAWGDVWPPEARRLEAALSPSVTARRLLAAADGVARVEAHDSGLAFVFDERGGARPEIVVDLTRLAGLPAGEEQAEYALALARAGIASPTPLVEVEQACWQWTAQVLAEVAEADPVFARALQEAELKPVPGAPALNRAALFLAQFEGDQKHAYWSVESAAGTPRLTDIEDLFALYAAKIRALEAPPEGPYVELSGRRYPAAIANAAFRLREPGALARLREALGAYDSVGVAPLRALILRRRRAP